MKKYAMMMAAAALIAAAPVYYAMTAQAEEAAPAPAVEEQMVEINIDCTKATLDGEAVPAECAAEMTKEIEPAAGEADPAPETAEPKAE